MLCEISPTDRFCLPFGLRALRVMAPMAAVINAPVEARITSKPPTLVCVVQISIRQE
jgi:hypothetical protein